MKFAFINDNMVVKIEEFESRDVIEYAHLFQQVVDVTGASPEPKVGWSFVGGEIVNILPDVTPRQIRQALILSGVSMQSIENALMSLPEPTRSLALTEWEYSIAFKRNRDLVKNVGVMLGWTPSQLDDLWIFAGRL